ncbi:hypothetical protein BD408DRAFT_424564, partial [Parasitella parasitica]
MSASPAGSSVYVVSCGYIDKTEGIDYEINPDIGDVKAFSSETEARKYMKNLAKEIYYEHVCGGNEQVDEDLNYLTPDEDSEGYYFNQKPNRILFGNKPWCGTDCDLLGEGYVKVEKLIVDDMVPTPETTPEPTDSKKRKL